MSIANSQRLLLCMILSLITCVMINATVVIDAPSSKSPTKEIIIISYDDIASTDLSSLISYIESVYKASAQSKVIIKNYGPEENLVHRASLTQVVDDIEESSVATNDIQVIQEEEVVVDGAYFTITVDASGAVQ